MKINKITNEDLIFMAGLFEGEGCIAISSKSIKDSKRRRHHLRVMVGNSDLSILKIFKDAFGVGTILHKKRTAESVFKFYSWVCCGQNAAFVLENLYPFFRSKRKKKEAELGIEFQKTLNDSHFSKYIRSPLTKLDKSKREKMYLKMKNLKSFGRTKW